MLIPLVAIMLVAIALLLACASSATRKPAVDRWPPISDEEFLRRCGPGVDPQRALMVRRIVANQLGIDYDRVYPEQRFVEDLGV